MTKPHAFPRKKLFVNREFQGRLLARTVLYWVLYHAVLWMAMFFYRYAEHRGAVMDGAEPRPFSDLYGQFLHEHQSMWLCAFAILPIVLWDLLKFSHRVVEPLVRFQRTLESLTAGETIHEVRLRNGDLLFDLQTTFNQYLASLRTLQSDSELASQKGGVNEPNSDHELIESQITEELQQLHTEIQAACAPANSAIQHAAR